MNLQTQTRQKLLVTPLLPSPLSIATMRAPQWKYPHLAFLSQSKETIKKEITNFNELINTWTYIAKKKVGFLNINSCGQYKVFQFKTAIVYHLLCLYVYFSWNIDLLLNGLLLYFSCVAIMILLSFPWFWECYSWN